MTQAQILARAKQAKRDRDEALKWLNFDGYRVAMAALDWCLDALLVARNAVD